MAVLYIDSAAGAGAQNGTSWADAYTTVAGAITGGINAGDDVRIDDGHTESLGATTYNFANGTAANPVIISVRDKADDSLSTQHAGGGGFTFSGNGAWQGFIHTRGIKITQTGGSTLLGNGPNDGRQAWENFHHVMSGGVDLTPGGTRALIRFIDLTIDFTAGAVGSSFAVSNTSAVEIYGGTFALRTAGTNNVFDCNTNSKLYVFGMAITGTCTNFLEAGDQAADIRFVRCILPTLTTYVDAKTHPAFRAEFFRCAAAGTITADPVGVHRIEEYAGTVTTDTTRYRTGGADDNAQANAYSLKFETNANAKEQFVALRGPWMARKIAKAASPSGATAQGLYSTSRMALGGTPAALSTDGDSTWNGATGTELDVKQLISDSLSNGSTLVARLASAATKNNDDVWIEVSEGDQVGGELLYRLAVAVPSATLYFDPQTDNGDAGGDDLILGGVQVTEPAAEAGGSGSAAPSLIPAGRLGDYDEDFADLNFKFSTKDETGAPITLAGSPAVSIYKSNDTTQSTAGVTLSVDFDSVTGLHNVKVDLSAAAFYATAEDYVAVLTAGTVGGISFVGTVLAHFSIGARRLEARTPTAASVANMNTVFSTDFASNYNTSADRWKVDMTHHGGTAYTAGAIASAAAGTANGSALTSDVTAVGTAVSGVGTAVTNQSTILNGLVAGSQLAAGTIGATGNTTTTLHLDGLTYGDDEINGLLLVIYDDSAAEYHAAWVTDWVLSTELATVPTLPFTPEASVDTYVLTAIRRDVNVAQFGGVNGTFASGRPDVNMTHAAGVAWGSGAITAAVIAGNAITAAKIADGAIDAATFAADVDAEVLSWLVDDATRIDASALNTATGTTIPAIVADTNELQTDWTNGGRLDLILDAILVDTAEIGAAGAGLTALPWNAAWDAEVESEVQDAIVANHLDHLLAATYDPASKPGAADALLNELIQSDAGVSQFTANALEQAPTGGGSGPTAAEIADAVWTEAIADHSGVAGSTAEALDAAATAGDPWAVDVPGSYTGTQAGKVLADILADTAEIGAAGVGLTEAGGTGDHLTAIVVSAGGITSSSFAAGAIDAAAIADAAIDAAAIAANAITSTKIADGTITAAKIAGNAITAAKIAGNAISATTFAADVDAEVLSWIVDDATRIDASALNTATGTTIPAILADTDVIGAAGAGLTAIPWNASWDAEVQSECADALVAYDALVPADLPANFASLSIHALGGVKVNTFDTGAIAAAAFAANSLTASALAADAVTEIQSGLSTLSAAQVNAEVVDALATDTYTEPTGVPGVTVSLAEKIGRLYMALRNRLNVTADKKTFFDDAGNPEWEKDLTDSGSEYSESKANSI